MPKQLKIFPEKCIGCKSCELACSLVNEGELNSSKSRITMIHFIEGRYTLPFNLPSTCRQCGDAPCIHSCRVDAISRLKDTMKTVVVDHDRCTGCGLCVSACPFGTMLFDTETKKAFKCELCEGEPACASICPSGAIVFVQQRPFYAKAQDLQMKAVSILSDRNRENLQRHKLKK